MRKKKRPLPFGVLGVAAAALTTVAALLGTSPAGASVAPIHATLAAKGTPVTIGVINQESGAAGTFPEVHEAMSAAADYINGHLGGVSGHSIRLDVCTTDGTAASSQQCAQQMVQDKPLYVMVGIDFYGPTIYSILSQAGIFAIDSVPLSTDELASNTIRSYQAGILGSDMTIALYAKHDLKGVKKLGIMVSQNPASLSAAQVLEAAAKKLGIATPQVTVPMTQTDFTGPVTSMTQQGVDAIADIIAGENNCAPLASAMVAENVKVPILSGACDTKIVSQQAGWYLALSTTNPAASTPDAAIYRKAMAQYEPKSPTTGFAPAGFQNMMTTFTAVLKPLGYSGLYRSSGTPKQGAVRAKLAESSGAKAFMGGALDCGAIKQYPEPCGFVYPVYKVGPAPSLNLQDGKQINVLPLNQELYGVG